jgi:2-oxoacid:acceptor oxidoreductase gamma subunit (pyruvate/2-ketoisovalerate family)
MNRELLLIGQGGMNPLSTAEILSEAITYRGKTSQIFQPVDPSPEVILRVAMRISNKPLPVCPEICCPDYTIVFDDSLLEVLNVTEGLKRAGILLVNSSYAPQELIERFGIEFSTATVDVKVVSIKEFDEKTSNNDYTGVLGAFCRISGEISLEILNRAVLARYPESIAQKLIKSMKNAFRTVKIA